MKKETLSQKELDLIPVIRQKWIDLAFKFHCDEKEIIKGVYWLYESCKLKKPIVLIMDSPLGCQIAANILKVKSQVWSQVSSQVWSQVS